MKLIKRKKFILLVLITQIYHDARPTKRQKTGRISYKFLSNLAEAQQIPKYRYAGRGRGNWKDPHPLLSHSTLIASIVDKSSARGFGYEVRIDINYMAVGLFCY